ncbi:MAG: hypothetical protein LUC91_00195 [Prevotella sp.]|nr:hypothetical protein [Prevotella sp.]
MKEIINDFILKNLGVSIVIVVAIFIIVIYATIYLYKAYQITKNVKNLPCDENNKRINDLEKNNARNIELPCIENTKSITRIDTSLVYIDKSISGLITRMDKLQANAYTKSESPLKITEKGKEMIARLGLDAEIDKNWSRINKFIDENVEMKNAYDVNDFCLKQAVVFPNKFIGDDMLLKIKNDAYFNGLELVDYMKVVAVMCRDRFFEEHEIETIPLTRN